MTLVYPAVIIAFFSVCSVNVPEIPQGLLHPFGGEAG